MQLSELQFSLPQQLIAQQPCEPRDAARLLVAHRASGTIEHRQFRDIGKYLDTGDCLVLNNTRVLPARFFCRRKTGGRVEALFVRAEPGFWHVLLKPSARLTLDELIHVEGTDTVLELAERMDRGEWRVRPEPACEPLALLNRVGRTPLPPYIDRVAGPSASDAERYQTVYAAQPGAVAAPTAGLHFTPALLDALGQRGVRRAEITLHVGPGTFLPIETESLRDHIMHHEWFHVPEQAAETLRDCRAAGGRIVAVGSTSARTLESFDDQSIHACGGATNLFIYPPYRFRHVDRLLTNFHLPGSTLLALVMAMAGIELTRAAYRAAIEQRYRFYSFGDAMLIL
ncbi:MAG: S-adenosylmethionine:tRNA ribosyltransferase-isomerase [Phycisphaerae bacterium]|nr:S-adenosylmethionine:tRNA ribosyltransferase-isomerase [Phycisphaerae bacterium]